MDIVLTYDKGTKEYKFYEPTTDTLLISKELGKGFISLNMFLSGQIGQNLLETDKVQYHIDSGCFQEIVRSNVNLLKRLSSGQSEFKTSADRFGGSGTSAFARSGLNSKKEGFGKSSFGGSKSSFNKSNKKWN